MSQPIDYHPAEEKNNSARFWDDLYGKNVSPWDTGKADGFLRQIVDEMSLPAGGAVLDVGCGTGTNTVWLAQQGFRTTGVDLSSVAIERARIKAASANAPCCFLAADILNVKLPNGSFDFAFDLGCFHEFELLQNRIAFANALAALLRPAGKLLSISGNADGSAFELGPPRRSARDIVDAFEPRFKILSLKSDFFDRDGPEQSQTWVCLMERRREE